MEAASLINIKSHSPLQLFDHSLNQHLLVVGQTGSGKTTSTVALLSDLQRAGHSAIILDPTGEYRHLPNAIVYQLGNNSYLAAGKLAIQQLLQVLDLPNNREWRRLVSDALTSLRVNTNLNNRPMALDKIGLSAKSWQQSVSALGKRSSDYPINQLPDQLIQEMIIPDPSHPQYGVLGQIYDHDRISHAWPLLNHLRTRLASGRFQKLFGEQGAATSYELTYVLKLFLNQPMQHQSLVLDLSLLHGQSDLQQLMVSLITQTILHLRLAMQTDFPITIVVDEAHRYLPRDVQSLPNNGIYQVLREGRKVNLSMLMTTQSPLDLVPELRSQFANVLLHRLSSPNEIRPWPTVDTDRIANQKVGEATYISTDQQVPVKVIQPRWWQKEHQDGIYS